MVRPWNLLIEAEVVGASQEEEQSYLCSFQRKWRKDRKRMELMLRNNISQKELHFAVGQLEEKELCTKRRIRGKRLFSTRYSNRTMDGFRRSFTFPFIWNGEIGQLGRILPPNPWVLVDCGSRSIKFPKPDNTRSSRMPISPFWPWVPLQKQNFYLNDTIPFPDTVFRGGAPTEKCLPFGIKEATMTPTWNRTFFPLFFNNGEKITKSKTPGSGRKKQTLTPPVGPALGSAGVPIQILYTVCDQTREDGDTVVSVVITVYDDQVHVYCQISSRQFCSKSTGEKSGAKPLDKDWNYFPFTTWRNCGVKWKIWMQWYGCHSKKIIGGTTRSMGIKGRSIKEIVFHLKKKAPLYERSFCVQVHSKMDLWNHKTNIYKNKTPW